MTLEKGELIKSGKSLDEEFKRYNGSEENWLKYTELQLAQRGKKIKDMERDYPNLPPSWCDMVYDYCYMTGDAEIERKIKAGDYDKPQKPRDTAGGIIKGALEILDSDGKLIEAPPTSPKSPNKDKILEENKES